ncbi:hypothetical protein BDZ85DRAFT_281666 [Elsinoe ampelina]|uniref:Uncharacterized protein n=1 Tax=Elsinoe ampelina TaxID=302913 RepID=A0A6A6GDJ9_9PEZI|nr:hypothetical protein BDZ85DRAFT_281666 [Elsinoe ampelina]
MPNRLLEIFQIPVSRQYHIPSPRTSLNKDTGLALSLYAWAVPVILEAQSAHTIATQFCLMVGKGAAYLQPTSRILGASLASLAVLSYTHPDPIQSAKWSYWAVALACVLPIAPYEVSLIFPINDEILEMRNEMDDRRSAGLANDDKKCDKYIREQIYKWRRRHVGRIVMPFAAFCLGIAVISS